MKFDFVISLLDESVRAVVLDMDGTLYRKHGLAVRMLWAMRGEKHLLLAERRTRRKNKGIWIGNPSDFSDCFFHQMAQGQGVSPHFARWWYHRFYLPTMVKLIDRYCHPEPWVKPLLQTCHEKHIPVVVLSDYEMATEKLTALHINTQYITAILSAPQIGGLKPASQLLDYIHSITGVPPKAMLVIGDRDDTDGAMARATGAQFLLVGKK